MRKAAFIYIIFCLENVEIIMKKVGPFKSVKAFIYMFVGMWYVVQVSSFLSFRSTKEFTFRLFCKQGKMVT